METITLDKVYKELILIKKELDYLKNHIIDEDNIMTQIEKKEYEESIRELNEGKTHSLEEIKKDRKNTNS